MVCVLAIISAHQLSMTKVELDLISIADMYLFFEKGIRGDVSYISKIYTKRNIKYLTSYDPKNQQNVLCTGPTIIYTFTLCQSLLQRLDLSGWTLLNLN